MRLPEYAYVPDIAQSEFPIGDEYKEATCVISEQARDKPKGS
jgi:hypothetical protein